MSAGGNAALFLDPPTHHFENDRLFALDSPYNRDGGLLPHIRLREALAVRGVPVHTADLLFRHEHVARTNVYVSLGKLRDWPALARRPGVRLGAFFARESPVVEPSLYRGLSRVQRHFRRVFSWSDPAALEPFVGGPVRCESFRLPWFFDQVHEASWRKGDRRFLVMINANKRARIARGELYTERLRAAAFFARTGEVDLYGGAWDEPPLQMGQSRLPYRVRQLRRRLAAAWDRLHPDPLLAAVRRVYRGRAPLKRDVIAQYTFALCFENMALAGYITEKLFDCFAAGTIPVYLGAPDIAAHVPPACYVDVRRFPDYAALRGFLRGLDAPAIRAYRESGRDFLNSPAFRPFSPTTWVERLARIVAEDTGSPG